MEGKTAPDFDESVLTTDQHGMLQILGSPRILDYRVLQFRLQPQVYEGVPSIAPPRYVHQACPVVTVLGRDRIIMPNGDLIAYLEDYGL